MLHCVVEFCATVLYVVMCSSCMLVHVLLDVTKSYYMLCTVVTCYIVLLNFVQQCYML